MGMGTIVANLGAGKYRIQLNLDRMRIDLRLKKLETLIPEVEKHVTDAEAARTEAGDQLNTALTVLNQLIVQDSVTPEGREKIKKQTEDVNRKRSEFSKKEADLFAKHAWWASLVKEEAFLSSETPADPIVDAWCADYREFLSGLVGTMEIPGERGLIQIQPNYAGGARYNPLRDGQLQPSIAGTPALVYYNWAMKPGWQKWMPTFRHGTITAITGSSCSVTLDAAKSGIKKLDINQANTLANVPIQYMDCDGGVFGVGDRVVVKFTDQDFTRPVVIGFIDHPRPCGIVLFGLKDDNFDSSYAWDLGGDKVHKVYDASGVEVSQPTTRDTLLAALHPRGYWTSGTIGTCFPPFNILPPGPSFSPTARTDYCADGVIEVHSSGYFIGDALYDDREYAYYQFIPAGGDPVIVLLKHSCRITGHFVNDPPELIYEWMQRSVSVTGHGLDAVNISDPVPIPFDSLNRRLPIVGAISWADNTKIKKAVLFSGAYNTQTGAFVTSKLWRQKYESAVSMDAWVAVTTIPAGTVINYAYMLDL